MLGGDAFYDAGNTRIAFASVFSVAGGAVQHRPDTYAATTLIGSDDSPLSVLCR